MAKKKILLVDDEMDLVKVMGTWIKRWGFDLVEAYDGIGAIEALETKNPDAVVLDYMLPGMDGVAVLKEIRKINKKIPVIMFTAYPDKIIKGAEKLDISAFVPKFSLYTDVLSSLKTAIDMAIKK
jgi:CheY-like chemotaxis protein